MLVERAIKSYLLRNPLVIVLTHFLAELDVHWRYYFQRRFPVDAASSLYAKNGLVLVDEYPGSQWGKEVMEQWFVRK